VWRTTSASSMRPNRQHLPGEKGEYIALPSVRNFINYFIHIWIIRRPRIGWIQLVLLVRAGTSRYEHDCSKSYIHPMRGRRIIHSTTYVSDYTLGVNESFESKFSPNRREMHFVSKCEPTSRVAYSDIIRRSPVSVDIVHIYALSYPPARVVVCSQGYVVCLFFYYLHWTNVDKHSI